MRIHSFMFMTAAIVTGVLYAQPPNAERQDSVNEMKQSLSANQASLKQYVWTETVQLMEKGEVKKTDQFVCQYAPDGEVIRSPAEPGMTDEQHRQRGLLRRDIRKKKEKEAKEYMEQVEDLVHEYVPPSMEKISAAQSAGTANVLPSIPTSKITITNYQIPGDSVTIGFNSAERRIVTYTADSHLDNKDENLVTMSATFAQLADGTNHVQQAIIQVPAKQISVTSTNTNYHKPGE